MLDELQVQLEAHFGALAALRKPVGYPVYAIEHGQSQQVIGSARAAAALHHQTIGLHQRHWLVWVVLAAEAGYGYDGDEYWPSLEATPGEWRSSSDRHALRTWFEKFHREFAGPTPEGRWAQHFSIIAWPIAGALLPKYLQGHFARHLFHVRYGLSRLADAGADEIGAYLATSGDQRSARYEDFLEQTDLTGRIVLALRDEDLNEPVPRIIPGTLLRIVGDLERRREAGEFLRAARQVLRSARGTVSTSLDGSRRPSVDQARAEDIVRPPRLVTRRGPDGSGQVGVHMPDFAAAIIQAGLTPTTFGRMRVRMSGEIERWSPGAALLSWSNIDIPLRAFPEGNVPVFEIEGAPAAVRHILEPLMLLEQRPSWLLRQEEDGAFRQVAGNHVRPTQTYVLLTRGAPLPELVQALALHPFATGLAGINAYFFRTPPTVSAVYRTALQKLGLGHSLRARVEPAGLSPVANVAYDGPSWAAGEDIMLRLSADFPASEFILELDNDRRSRFAATDAAIFVSLGALPVGRHKLRVSTVAKATHPDAGIDISPVAFDFDVFEPRPWTDVASERAGFRVLLDPPNASLESLLTDQAAISLYGPPGRRVVWRLDTVDASGHVVGGGPLVQTRLPMAANGFAPALRRFKDYSDAIDAAHRVDLVADLEELGRQTVRFPHQVAPLRWSLDPARGHLRLIDETAHDEMIDVARMDLTSPVVRREASSADLLRGIDLPEPGALFSAAYKGERYVAFVSVPAADRLTALSDLGVVQDFHPGPVEPPQAVVKLIAALQLWRRARPIGRMAALRKAQTLTGLLAELRRTSCGADWSASLGANASPNLVRAQPGVGGSPGFGSLMRTTGWRDMSLSRLQSEFFRHAQHYQITQDRELADQAVTLAFRPWSFRSTSGVKPSEAVARLLTNRPLVRGAFLAQAAALVTHEALVA
ncbi:MAG: hypothetical protein V4701_01335 [Pseudomonadota bacterium]